MNTVSSNNVKASSSNTNKSDANNASAHKLTTMALQSIYSILLLTVILGLVYPFVTTKVANLLFSEQANGSIVTNEQGQAIASKLIAQNFNGTILFKSRPSAVDYNGASSGGSNYGPTNEKLSEQISERRNYWLNERAKVGAPLLAVPLDLLTASGSGLDPHLTVDALMYQVPIVANQTKIAEVELIRLINENTISSIFSSRDYVNVLELNLQLKDLLAKQGITELKLSDNLNSENNKKDTQ